MENRDSDPTTSWPGQLQPSGDASVLTLGASASTAPGAPIHSDRSAGSDPRSRYGHSSRAARHTQDGGSVLLRRTRDGVFELLSSAPTGVAVWLSHVTLVWALSSGS